MSRRVTLNLGFQGSIHDVTVVIPDDEPTPWQWDEHLSTWEAQLVGEAVADGATWETIGSSVGVSRQAAWQRFHHEAHDFRRHWKSEFHDLRNKHRDEMMELRDRLKGESRSRRRPTREGRGDIV